MKKTNKNLKEKTSPEKEKSKTNKDNIRPMSNLNSEANENTKKEEDSKTNNPATQEKEPEKAAAKRSKLDSLFDAPIEEKPKVVVQVKNDINAKNNEKLNKQKQKYMEIKNQTETKKKKRRRRQEKKKKKEKE